MAAWKQVGGDMTWERHGVVLASAGGDWVELVRIVPWLELDREAAVTHGLYVVDTASLAIDDLEDEDTVAGALSSTGLEREEYDELAPEYKAQAVAEYAGYEESRSVDTLAECLPAVPEEIHFWGGPETTEKIAEYDAELRRESLEANFETRLKFGRLPPRDALAFALGDAPPPLELEPHEALALEYGCRLARVASQATSPEEFVVMVQALVDAKRPSDLTTKELAPDIERIVGTWTDEYGDPNDEDDGIAVVCRGVAGSLLQAIGFEWT